MAIFLFSLLVLVGFVPAIFILDKLFAINFANAAKMRPESKDSFWQPRGFADTGLPGGTRRPVGQGLRWLFVTPGSLKETGIATALLRAYRLSVLTGISGLAGIGNVLILLLILMSNATPRIKDATLRTEGQKRHEWTRTRMPIMRSIAKSFAADRPFDGLKIAICLHVEPKTGVWLEALTAGGAEIAITGSPGTTVDSTAAYLDAHPSITVFARREESFEDHLVFANRVLETGPDLVSDNGADLHALIHTDFAQLKTKLIGATEETTSGGYRLREEIESVSFPTIVINDSRAKRIIENRFGVGQSVVEAIQRATNALVAGLKAAVIGYGYCGRGIALSLKGLGARVTVVDIDPLTRLDALLEGFEVKEKPEAISENDLIISVTGRDHTLSGSDFSKLRDGAIVANAGHFEFELDLEGLSEMAGEHEVLNKDLERFEVGGKDIFLLGKGRPVNLASGDGNPIEVMDLGLALQSLSLKHLVENGSAMKVGPQNVPNEVERKVSELAFEAWR